MGSSKGWRASPHGPGSPEGTPSRRGSWRGTDWSGRLTSADLGIESQIEAGVDAGRSSLDWAAANKPASPWSPSRWVGRSQWIPSQSLDAGEIHGICCMLADIFRKKGKLDRDPGRLACESGLTSLPRESVDAANSKASALSCWHGRSTRRSPAVNQAPWPLQAGLELKCQHAGTVGFCSTLAGAFPVL